MADERPLGAPWTFREALTYCRKRKGGTLPHHRPIGEAKLSSEILLTSTFLQPSPEVHNLASRQLMEVGVHLG